MSCSSVLHFQMSMFPRLRNWNSLTFRRQQSSRSQSVPHELLLTMYNHGLTEDFCIFSSFVFNPLSLSLFFFAALLIGHSGINNSSYCLRKEQLCFLYVLSPLCRVVSIIKWQIFFLIRDKAFNNLWRIGLKIWSWKTWIQSILRRLSDKNLSS